MDDTCGLDNPNFDAQNDELDDDLSDDRSRAVSAFDVANRVGNIAADIPTSLENLTTDGTVQYSRVRTVQWELNYKEAAIYLEEGEANDKFTNHPRSQEALPAYFLAHNRFFYLSELCSSLLLLALTMFEPPAVVKIPNAAHASLEMLCLFVMFVELVLKLRWLGWKTFVKHPRTMFKASAIAVMVVEAVVILIRRTSHIRVTRTIRPLFFLDCHYSSSVRRFMRQLVQSLKPVFQMLALLIFFMIIFSILGFYLFHTIESDSYFDTIWTSFISLFVLLTTANYPDVMMPAYNNSRWSCIFFIIYLAVELYFVMNLVLAVVYESFTRFEKAKLKKLFLHKRQACQYAFSLLVSKRHPKQISIRHFQGLLKFYKPRKKKTDVYLMFKTLNRSKTGFLTLEEFCEIYDITRLNWKKCPVAGPFIWSANFRRPLDKCFRGVHWFVSLKAFDFVISGVILANFIFLLAETVEISLDKSVTEDQFYLTWYNVTFVSVYLVELILKLLGLGPHEYFADNWNTFDFVVTLSGVCGLVLQVFIHGFAFIILLRLFRLLRLFKVSQTFRDVLGTLYILMSRLFSLSVAILMTYYIFAIIGIEIFHKFDMRDCCVNSSVEQYYVYDNGSINQGYYYLNDFHNILAAGVTLFELTVVNNWFIIMEGYAYVCSEWSRIYFMVFYLNMMVVMNVIVAFLLEAFLFRIQYRRHMSCQDIDEHAKIMIDVQLASTELAVIQSPSVILNSYYLMNMQLNLAATEGVWYRGERMRSKEDFSLRMYAEEVKEWIEEEQRRSCGRTTVSELDEFHTSVDRLNINAEQSNSAVNLT